MFRQLRSALWALPPKVESNVHGSTTRELEQLVKVLLDFSGRVEPERWLQARQS